MSERLPPLTALRAFDAAARHMSFSKAAAEMNVTPAALSFQIKSLEGHLQAPLFRRLNRAVELTDAGKALAPGASDGFTVLASAWRAAKRTVDQTSLTVTAGPGFTAKWLAPRLFKFAMANPEIELRFSASLRLMDFARDDVDVAIRFGMARNDPDLYSKRIIGDWVAPMMTPELAKTYPKAADLARAPLLHQDDTRFIKPAVDWPAWFRAANLPPRFAAGARFSHADHAIDAAVAGAGVVLGRISLAEKDLREGRLVMPYKIGLTTDAHYSFVCPLGSDARPQVQIFREWIERETSTLKDFQNGITFVSAAEVEI